MDFALYQSLIRELDEPEIIRLNYSGESAHYPHLIDAIKLARDSGATTELVSAFASFPPNKVEALVKSGLDRLTISLHTLDPDRFSEIYRFSSIAELRSRIEELLAVRERLHSTKPEIDIAVVAMNRNIDELPAIAEYARQIAVRSVSIHPVIRRDEIPIRFEEEVAGRQLRPEFAAELQYRAAGLRHAYPEISFHFSTAEAERLRPIGAVPKPFAGPLPAGARIYSCDQDPWQTIHVLANGDVVTCEVRDKVVVGNLHNQTLREIWLGPAYQRFRRQYEPGAAVGCRTCPYKIAYIPGPLASTIKGGDWATSQLLSGWHRAGEPGIVWSKRRATAVLARPADGTHLRITGILPAGPGNTANALEVSCGGSPLGTLQNLSGRPMPFDVRFEFPPNGPKRLHLQFAVQRVFRPCDEDGCGDVRQLGFALSLLSAAAPQVPDPELPGDGLFSRVRSAERALRNRVRQRLGSARLRLLVKFKRLGTVPLTVAIALAEALAPIVRRIAAIGHSKEKFTGNRGIGWQPGMSIVIPERDAPEMLEECLASVQAATAELAEPHEVIVMVNGAARQPYASLMSRYPAVRWLHSEQPMGFSAAVRAGAQACRYDWVYLLNNDMVVAPDAFSEVLRWRAPHVFAIASQIFLRDGARRREETGWTGIRLNYGLEIFDMPPGSDGIARGNVYAGGGSSLFRRELLLRLMKCDAYEPFYWEDVEWGVRAWRQGYEILFCPASKVWHRHRATVSRFYDAREIGRIFRRNAILFGLRNRWLTSAGDLWVPKVRRLDRRSRAELSGAGNAWRLFVARLQSAAAPFPNFDFDSAPAKYYPAPHGPEAPKKTIVAVTPFAIFPPVHGSAIRIVRILQRLSSEFRIILLSDEGDLYPAGSIRCADWLGAVHLIHGRPQAAGDVPPRIARIRSHSHVALQTELARLVSVYRADVVQIEHAELADMVSGRQGDQSWFITLHDVYISVNGAKQEVEDAYELSRIEQFDACIVCSPEDAKLLPPGRVCIVPNGCNANRESYRPSTGNVAVLFAGPFRYPPNLDGIREFLETVYPRLRATIPNIELNILGGQSCERLAGRNKCFQQNGVRVIGPVEDVRPWLDHCAVTINPVHDIRGSSLKLIESLAAGRVCVSTTDGARGFPDEKLSSLTVVPRIADFEAPLLKLLVDEPFRLSMERLSLSEVSPYDWNESAAVQLELYEKHLARK